MSAYILQMENREDWLAPDKLYHFLFCFFISVIFSLIATRTRYPFIRRRSIWVGSIASLAAGVAKEVADEFGFFQSAGASAKDAVFDLLGVLVAAFVLSLVKPFSLCLKTDQLGQVRGLEMV